MANITAIDALGDPTRRTIIELLGAGPLSVGELAQELPVSQPAVSQHLKVLKEAGLVNEHRAGNRRIYHVVPEALEEVVAYFDNLWEQALASYQAAAGRGTTAQGAKDQNQSRKKETP